MKSSRVTSLLASISVMCLSVFAVSSVAGMAEAKQAIPISVNIVDVLKFVFDSVFLSQVLSIAGVILLDWAFGVALAVRDGKFEFNKLADFYRTQIMPKLIGWVALTVVLKLAAFFAIGELSAAIPLSIAGLTFAIIMVALVAAVAAKVKDLLGSDVVPPYNPPAAK